VSTLASPAASDKDLVKVLAQLASWLKSLDECPEEELPEDQADAIFGMSNDSHCMYTFP
jgi:condensin complex subunit 3